LRIEVAMTVILMRDGQGPIRPRMRYHVDRNVMSRKLLSQTAGRLKPFSRPDIIFFIE
jgi:hypothetical protein